MKQLNPMGQRSAKAKAEAKAQSANAALTRARDTAAKEIGCEPGDFRAIRLATLMTAHEALQAALVAGERIDFKDLLDVDRALADLRKEIGATKPMDLNVHIVEAEDAQECPACKHKFKLATVRRSLEESRRANLERMASEPKPVQPSGPPKPSIVDAVPGAYSIRTGRTPAPPKVVELKRPSIHDPLTFADGTTLNPPLKKLEPREAWSGYAIPPV